jgi:hypothetical protein
VIDPNFVRSFPTCAASLRFTLPILQTSRVSEPHNTTTLLGLDLLLIQSNPPNSTELRKANLQCLTVVESASDLPTLAKRYISRLT